MRNLLASGLAVFAGMVSLPARVSPHQTQEAPASSYQQDPRLKRLEKFFQSAGCPAQKYSDTFLEAADAYGLDWRLLPSISFIESTGGKAARNNNLFGWDSGRAEFASPAAGIHTVGYRLSHSSLYRHKDLDGILATYNPDAEYAAKVKAVMRRISPSE
jgi:Mannosyl-glycoprotein endo-beta-N-acetylglucosaminidase